MMHYHPYPPPPPPVATGPGPDRPLYAATTPSPDYGIADTSAFGGTSNGHHANATNGGYAMSRTRKYYHQDHHLDKDEAADRKASFG